MTTTHGAQPDGWSTIRLTGREHPVEEVPRAGRLTGVDGLRAVAVAAVVLFHLDPDLLPGGFLGVDIFFVISGFLITRLLLSELVSTGAIRLGQFYRRRAKRLFPAAAALMLAVAAASVLAWRDELATLPGSALSSLGYATNWWLIFDRQSYFVSTGRPPMLQHLWSLAIEEQYYLVWSVLVVALTAAVRQRSTHSRRARVRLTALVALGLAVASTVAMAAVAIRTNVPYVSDSSRVYFGTDTHSMGLLLGSAGGAYSALLAHRTGRGPGVPAWLTDLGGALGLGVLAWQLRHLSEYVPGLYRGGFLALDGLALVVVFAITRSGSWLGGALDAAPVRWIGQRSYSIYLWHWPVVVITRPGIDVHGPVLLIDLARAGLILALAAVSYRYVEQPLRSGTWLQHGQRVRRAGSPLRVNLPVAAAVACAGTLAFTALPQGTQPAAGPAEAASRPVASGGGAPIGDPVARHPVGNHPVAHHPVAHHPVAHHPTARPRPVSAFGDSVLLGARSALEALDRDVDVDAVEGRAAFAVLDDIQAREQAGRLAQTVVIHTGDNGIINPTQLSSTLALLGNREKVVLVTDRVPRDWQDPNNQTLASAARHAHNVTLLDWNALSAAHPDWFYDDGMHLDPTGAAAYAKLILTAAEQ